MADGGDSTSLVPAAADVAMERDFDAETKPIAARLAKIHHEIIEAAQHFADDDEEIDKLPPKQARIARWARMPKQEAPYALQMAHEFTLMRERRVQALAPKRINLNIGTQNNYGVALPAKAPEPKPEDVVIIDAEVLNPEEGDE